MDILKKRSCIPVHTVKPFLALAEAMIKTTVSLKKPFMEPNRTKVILPLIFLSVNIRNIVFIHFEILPVKFFII